MKHHKLEESQEILGSFWGFKQKGAHHLTTLHPRTPSVGGSWLCILNRCLGSEAAHTCTSLPLLCCLGYVQCSDFNPDSHLCFHILCLESQVDKGRIVLRLLSRLSVLDSTWLKSVMETRISICLQEATH